MPLLDPEAASKRQGALMFTAGLIFAVLGAVGVFIADRPDKPDWFDLIGLTDASWQVMVLGAFGVLVGGGIMAWRTLGPGDPQRDLDDEWKGRQ